MPKSGEIDAEKYASEFDTNQTSSKKGKKRTHWRVILTSKIIAGSRFELLIYGL
jgi:hypothetical protein